MIYAFAYSQLRDLQFNQSATQTRKSVKAVYDPPATEANLCASAFLKKPSNHLSSHPADMLKIVKSLPNIPLSVVTSAVPYAIDAALFVAFVEWNGGIVLGEPGSRSHLPKLIRFKVTNPITFRPCMFPSYTTSLPVRLLLGGLRY